MITILDAMADPRIFGKWFASPSWNAWKAFLAALFALPMNDAQLALYRHHTGRQSPPLVPFRECWVCAGRRSGKSAVAALISVYMSIFRDWRPYLGPGEVCTAMVVSPDRKQSRIIRRFQAGFCRSIPAIAPLIVNETKDSLEFDNRTALETQTASDAVRGYVSHVIVNDEVCFLPVDGLSDPDKEVISAERPCLASLPGSILLSISSPYGRRGCMYEAFEAHYGKDDSPVLFWKGTSLEMNPTLDPQIIAAAFEADAVAAAAEWNADFRSDCERLFTLETLDAITDFDRPLILPFQKEEVA
jgi:hypothetical protein